MLSSCPSLEISTGVFFDFVEKVVKADKCYTGDVGNRWKTHVCGVREVITGERVN